ncbi:YgfZ/GcvT domain-containing protein [Rubrobacter taiwanensis]|nr:folate-binding protein YgfZ [Rubrobacter taiwanensis]
MKHQEKTVRLPLHELHDALGAEFTRFGGCLVPADYGDALAELAALEHGTGLVDRSFRPIFRLSGRDPSEMLRAVVTNEIPQEPDRGAYAALLSPKGRIQTDLRILKTGETAILLDTEPEGETAAQKILGRYAPFSRLKLETLSPEWGMLGLYGPQAPALLNLNLPEHASSEVEIGGARLLAAGTAHPLPGCDLLGPPAALRTAWETLISRGARPAGLRAFETARIAAGIPRFGADMDDAVFPAEAGILERAVSLKKGCYPGQETVARMHYRGRPRHTLHRFTVTGKAPAGAEILQEDARVGALTSISPLPVRGKTLALGYLHRKADPEKPLHAGDAELQPF